MTRISCRSELARDGHKHAAIFQEIRVIVDVHRERARADRWVAGTKKGAIWRPFSLPRLSAAERVSASR